MQASVGTSSSAIMYLDYDGSTLTISGVSQDFTPGNMRPFICNSFNYAQSNASYISSFEQN